ncbi:MAG: matrixin family metalloprotease [Syntrophaceae bacterium]|nr:matrixin family metalloprotease [Syntrophaceae bacterium]
MKRFIILLLSAIFVLCFCFPVQADRIDKRSEEATDIIVGKIKHIKSYYATNKWRDDLIMSEITLKVDKALKGERPDELSFIIEGGVVGDMVLRVSKVPLFEEGERLVFYLKKKDAGFEYLDSTEVEATREKGKPAPKLPCCKTFAKWPDPSVGYAINPNAADMTQHCIDSEIIAGADAWNDTSGIKLRYAGATNISTVSSSDDNVVFFRDEESGSTIAVTYIWYTRKGGSIIAFDMVFYDYWTFFGLTSGCNGTDCNTGFYLQPIAAHEFGHAIGLDHNRCQSSLMFPYASYCESSLLAEEDATCIQRLYPY